jgi:adenylate kinase
LSDLPLRSDSGKPFVTLILGAPGSGKGTQSALLANRHSIPHISLGAILRADVLTGGQFAVEARVYLETGDSVPVALMRRVLHERFGRSDTNSGFVGDGLVRTVDQAKALDEMLTDIGLPLGRVVYLRTPDAEIKRRLRERRVCELCGLTYRVSAFGTGVELRCRADGGPVTIRSDDSEAIVDKRLRDHHRSTGSILSYYGATDLLRQIDGNLPAVAVFEAIASILARG